MKKSNVDEAISKGLFYFNPPQKIKISDWAESNLYLPAAISAFPGRLSLDLSPHIKHILDAVDNPSYKKFTWISSVQSGKTLFEMILAAYFMAYDPSPILLYEKDGELARDVAVRRFNPLIEANDVLKELFKGPNARNNDEEKLFAGGSLSFCSAGALSDLISRSARIVLMDEVDTYTDDLKGRGTPVQLARDRAIQQPRAKFFMVGSPGTEGSELFASYEKSNKAVIQYACIHCGEFQELKFDALKWESGSEGYGAWLECRQCKKKMYDSDKPKFFKNSRLHELTKKPVEKNHFGLHTNGLYSMSPELTWEQIAVEHVSAHRRKDYADRKRFTNSILAEVFSANHKIKENELMARAKTYHYEVPRQVAILTAGIDVQHNRLAVTVLGFGKNDMIYVIDYKEIYGNTKIDPDTEGLNVWKELDIYLNKSFKHETEGREIYIRTAFLDVSDGQNPMGKKYVKNRMVRGIFGCSGTGLVKDGDGYIGQDFHDKVTKMPIKALNVNMIKHELFDRLEIYDHNTYGYITFPKHLDELYYQGLVSEKWVEEKKSGVIKGKFKKIHERNEPLDCFVYAFAAFQSRYGREKARVDAIADEMLKPIVKEEVKEESIKEAIKEESDKKTELNKTENNLDNLVNAIKPINPLHEHRKKRAEALRRMGYNKQI